MINYKNLLLCTTSWVHKRYLHKFLLQSILKQSKAIPLNILNNDYLYYQFILSKFKTNKGKMNTFLLALRIK